MIAEGAHRGEAGLAHQERPSAIRPGVPIRATFSDHGRWGQQECNPMSNPVGGCGRDACYPHNYDDPIGQAAQRYCRQADTVTSGFLCDEDTVVSNACRSPRSSVDAYVCDDKKMASLQGQIWNGLKEAAKVLFTLFAGRTK
jgi:hypothetical protein